MLVQPAITGRAFGFDAIKIAVDFAKAGPDRFYMGGDGVRFHADMGCLHQFVACLYFAGVRRQFAKNPELG